MLTTQDALRLIAPGRYGVAVTYTAGVWTCPTDQKSKAIYVGGSGNITLTDKNGTSLTFNSVPVGFLDFAPQTIVEATTTATGLIVVYLE